MFSHFSLFQNTIFHKMLNIGFWNFESIFVRMYLLFAATLFLSLWLSIWLDVYVLTLSWRRPLSYRNQSIDLLTLSWRRSLSYRNKSTDLLCKLMDWFLYDDCLRHERVKQFLWDINVYHITFGDKILRGLVLHAIYPKLWKSNHLAKRLIDYH